MKASHWIFAGALLAATATARADTATPTADAILQHFLESDTLGLSGASISARATLIDRGGSKSELVFTARSKRLGPGLAESVVRFSAPADLAGAGFLQIQKKDGDDERYLFLPDLKRSRRISGSLRSNAFMGTDLSFADLDRRDFRDASVTLTGSETVDRWDCYVLDVTPKGTDSEYSHAELWLRKDNYVPMRMKFYDRGRALLKTFVALEVRRVSGQWFISRSTMTNAQKNHATELALENISTTEQASDDDFTIRALEKSR